MSSYKDGSHKKHGASHKSPMHSDPDKGHPMIEGEMPFDMGYQTQTGNESAYMPEAHERGNDYTKHQNEIKHRDMKKLESGKFTKIA